MQTGRSFAAHFEDDASREAYLMWSAAQMLVYNAKVEESNFFWKFRCKFWSPEPLPKPDQKYALPREPRHRAVGEGGAERCFEASAHTASIRP